MDSPFALVLIAGLFFAIFDRYAIWQLSALFSHYGHIPVYDARRKLDGDRVMKVRFIPLCLMPFLAPVTRMDDTALLIGGMVFTGLLGAYCLTLYQGWSHAQMG